MPLAPTPPSGRGGGAVGTDLSGLGAGEHAVEIRDAAVRNPRLDAVQDVVRTVAERAAGHRGDVGARLRLRQGERRDRLAATDARQVARRQFRGSGDRQRAAAQPLHGECEVGQPVMICERLPDQAQGADVELRRRAAVLRPHAMAQQPIGPERAHQIEAAPVDLRACLHVRELRKPAARPVLGGRRDGAVLGPEERQRREVGVIGRGGRLVHRPTNTGLARAANAS
jgi:hypothetical protein